MIAPTDWRAILDAVVREHPKREGWGGNAPGHGHRVRGIWDEDNGALAGKPCAWCLTWQLALRALAEAPAERNSEGPSLLPGDPGQDEQGESQ